jgi:hypothetical protein
VIPEEANFGPVMLIVIDHHPKNSPGGPLFTAVREPRLIELSIVDTNQVRAEEPNARHFVTA